MAGIRVSELDFAHPGSDSVFFDLSFSVLQGECAALVGPNGAGKTTLFKVLAGELRADGGSAVIDGSMLAMPQDVGMSAPERPLRELLTEIALPDLRETGRRLVTEQRALSANEGDGMAYAEVLARWGDLGGYALEAIWAGALERSVGKGVQSIDDRKVSELSGGERKRLVLDVLFRSHADVLLLDEPDNYLDVPTREWLEAELMNFEGTVLLISHDRSLLETAATKVVALDGGGCWVHGDSYATFGEAREARQRSLGDAVARWKEEERRLYRHMKTMKQRAAMSSKNAPKAKAAESRWERFVTAGPPPAPVRDEHIRVSLTGGDGARRVVQVRGAGVDDLFFPFSDEVMFGERLALIGPNGTGKSHLLSLLARRIPAGEGEVLIGPRTSIGQFTQINDRADFQRRNCLEIVTERTTDEESAMKALARYGLAVHATQNFDILSGGEKARIEVLCLELEGHNLLLLDEPTDNLDVESAEALERALADLSGTVIAVSHDRAFLRMFDRFWFLSDSGEVFELSDYDTALEALRFPNGIDQIRRARPLVDVS